MLNHHFPKCLKASGQSDLFKRMSFQEFQDSHHLRYWKGKILANVNLHNTMSQTKFNWFWTRCGLKNFKDGHN